MLMRILFISFTLMQLCCMPVYAARPSLFEADFDEEKKPWNEVQAQLPAYPEIAAAIPFEVPSRNIRFYVDPKSISVGNDGVVRFSLVAKSPSGVLNVSYQGIRCETREKKLYAIGRRDGTWSRNRFAKWDEIQSSAKDPEFFLLYNDFFCPDSDIVGDANEAISALQSGVHPRAKR